ncbi:hypothetical protein RIF29_27225 [Crotalaria pallida]|uniref:Reverse transcriptase zinc-binding domain-containing protein n=1 Tax=Crotalaria pallida TaxID=3830 RepID=A0AAN9ENP6_CROPI
MDHALCTINEREQEMCIREVVTISGSWNISYMTGRADGIGWRLSNDGWKHRNLSQDGSCSTCRDGEETISHVLRDCPYAKQVWKFLVHTEDWDAFMAANMNDWMVSNLARISQFARVKWSILFGTVLETLWMRRNKKIFENEDMQLYGIMQGIWKKYNEIVKAKNHCDLLSNYAILCTA